MAKEVNRKELEKLTVKELRRQAAIHNVQLTQIAAAIEKADLINLIIRAGPVRDTYDVSLGVKVHSAESIEALLANPRPKPAKKAKKKGGKKRRRSSGSTRSSGSSSSASQGGRRKKKSRSRKRSRSRKGKRRQKRSRSPSLQMLAVGPAPVGALAPLPAPAPASAPVLSAAAAGAAARRRRLANRLRALPAPGDVAAAPAPKALKALPPSAPLIVDAVDDDDSDEVAEVTASPGAAGLAAVSPRTAPAAGAVQAGVAAAAALGFDVLPKAPAVGPAAPASGLRPSVNPGAARGPVAAALAGSAGMPGARICMSYISHARCELGANCPEVHVMDPEEEMRVRARFKEQECRSGASCTRLGCLFRHPGEQLDTAM